MNGLTLHMVLLGCTPKGRHIEQHDIFFDITEGLKALVPAIVAFWPEAEGKIHIDGWRQVTHVDGYKISVVPKAESVSGDAKHTDTPKLFFINLGGYKPGELEEYHYKMLAVGVNKGIAVQQAKQTAFYKHTGFKGAESHIDDKYGVDVDDVYAIEDILPPHVKEKYTLELIKDDSGTEDILNLGYFILSKL